MALSPSMLNDPIFGHAPTRAHFEDQAFAEAMLRVEVALARAQADLGIVPAAAAGEIAALRGPSDATAELAAGVAASGVPVPALIDVLRRELSEDAANWLHFGATSQDIVDTAFCLCAQAALGDLSVMLAALIDTLEALSTAHAETLMLGRTRGQLATPITFGLRVAQWAQPMIALEAQMGALKAEVLRVQLGGASGSRSAFGALGEDVARRMAEALDLADGPPWHADRSGMRRLAGWLGRLVAALGKIGKDVAISTRGEVAELRLARAGRSSTMPHKSNAVRAEALQSLMPVAAGYEAGLAAGAIHAEERDGAHWSVEWALVPQLFETAGAGLAHATALCEVLEVDSQAMRDRVEAEPAVRAEAAVFALAQKTGGIEAARIVAAALASGRPLWTALAEHQDIDWDTALSDAGFTSAAARTARQIFTARGADKRRA